MLKRIIKVALRQVGLDLRRCQHGGERLNAFFKALKKLGFEPQFVIDIGANHGNWTRTAIRYFPKARYLMIEPQERLTSYSSDLLGGNSAVKWKTAGVSDTCGSMMLTLTPRDYSCNFRCTEAEARSAGFEQIEVPITTLDTIASVENEIPALVKIDAEGLDLRVLHGASNLFGKTEVFFVECGMCDRSVQNSLPEVCRFMGDKGYLPVDFTDLNQAPKSGVLWLCEVVFIKAESAIWNHLDTSDWS